MKFRLIDAASFSMSSRWNSEYFLSESSGERPPVGFQRRQLSELVEERGEFLAPQDYPEMTFNYLGLENVSQATRFLVDFSPKRGSEIKSRSKVFRRGDILYGRLRPGLDKCLIVGNSLPEGICSTEIFVLIPNLESIHPEYLAELLVSREVHERVVSLVAGSALPRIQYVDFLSIPVPVPSLEMQQEFVSNLMSAREELEYHLRRSHELPDQISHAVCDFALRGTPFSLRTRENESKIWNNPLPKGNITISRLRRSRSTLADKSKVTQ